MERNIFVILKTYRDCMIKCIAIIVSDDCCFELLECGLFHTLEDDLHACSKDLGGVHL